MEHIRPLVLFLFLPGPWFGLSAQEVARAPFRLFDSRRGFTAWTSPGYEQVPISRSEPTVVGKFYKKARGASGYPSPYRPRYVYILLDDKVRPNYYLKQRYRGRFKVTEREPRRIALEGIQIKEFHLAPNPEVPQPGIPQEGLAVFFHHLGAYAAFIGFCPRNKFKKERLLFRKLGYTIRFPSSENGATPAPATDPYEGSELRGLDFRRQVRAELIHGYRVLDTENYILIHHPMDRAFANKVKRDLEILHAHFREVFPPCEPVTAVGKVRVCRSRATYYLHGGRPIYAGYWNVRSEELVLQQCKRGDLGKNRDRDSFFALYREAYYQYIYLFSGKMVPHIWFTDGHGDYFSGTVLSRSEGKVKSVRAHPARVKVLRDAVRTGEAPSLSALVEMTAGWYYRNRSLHQAMAWGLIFFLRRSQKVEAEPAWNRILDTYYRVLRDEYARHIEGLADDAKRTARSRVVALARAAAREAAFQGVDMVALEKAWRRFVLRIPAQRK